MYLFMHIQLSIVFKNTSYQVHKSVKYLHFIIFCVLVFLSISMAVLNMKGMPNAIVTLPFFVLAGGGATHMAYLFNKKLYLMLSNERKCAQSRSNKRNTITSCYADANNEMADAQRQLSVLKIIVKVTNLFGLIFISTVMIIAVLCLLILWRNELTLFIWFIGFSVYAIIPPFCIFLMLKINEDIYGCVCKCCHTQFNKLCDHLVDRNAAMSTNGLELPANSPDTDATLTVSTPDLVNEIGEKDEQEPNDNIQIAISMGKTDD